MFPILYFLVFCPLPWIIIYSVLNLSMHFLCSKNPCSFLSKWANSLHFTFCARTCLFQKYSSHWLFHHIASSEIHSLFQRALSHWSRPKGFLSVTACDFPKEEANDPGLFTCSRHGTVFLVTQRILCFQVPGAIMESDSKFQSKTTMPSPVCISLSLTSPGRLFLPDDRSIGSPFPLSSLLPARVSGWMSPTLMANCPQISKLFD